MNDPRKKPFGKFLSEHSIMLERVARSRIEIDAARLAVLNAAITIDSKVSPETRSFSSTHADNR